MTKHHPHGVHQADSERGQRMPRQLMRLLGIGGIGLAIIIFTMGDLAEVLPGLDGLVASPVFPFIHESHDIAAVMLCLYIAHRVSPGLGYVAIIGFLMLHIPYALLIFFDEPPKLLRLLLMSGAAVFGINIIRTRVQLEKELMVQAMRDSLTGLLNNRHYHLELEYHLEQSRRYGERGAMFFVDLDGFKEVNDRLGHQAGDELLKRVAEVLQQNLRKTDSIARLGGDEFAAILPHTDAYAAHVAADRFRQALSAVTAQSPVAVSASIGLVVYPDDGDSVESLLASADRAMYQAKLEGRNRIVVVGKQLAAMPSLAHAP